VALKKLLLVVLVVLVPPAVYAFARAGQVSRVATAGGELVSTATGGGCRVAWIEQDDTEARLLVVRALGEAPRILYRAPSLSGLAVAEGAAFVTQGAEPHRQSPASLVRIGLASGDVRELAAAPWLASDIAVGADFLCWREHRAASLPGVNFVSAAVATDVIRARRLSDGETSRIAVISGEEGAPSGATHLIGVGDGSLYWAEYRTETREEETVLRRTPLPGVDSVTIAREQGLRSALLSGGALLWTAPSAEGGEFPSFTSVKRLVLGDSTPAVVADWLAPSGQLAGSDGTVYVRERSGVWTLGAVRGEQRRTSRWLPEAAAYHVVRHSEYAFVRRASGFDVVSRPLNWRGRLLQVGGPWGGVE
jgi:hypothetical protein